MNGHTPFLPCNVEIKQIKCFYPPLFAKSWGKLPHYGETLQLGRDLDKIEIWNRSKTSNKKDLKIFSYQRQLRPLTLPFEHAAAAALRAWQLLACSRPRLLSPTPHSLRPSVGSSSIFSNQFDGSKLRSEKVELNFLIIFKPIRARTGSRAGHFEL